ncbi:dynamin family protein [Metabacillus litoralis]|uniref:dynamin family protein n=1 Tax=Metabacillus litoralis TaxID=152268 RepID=UPI00204045D0|nr:dynamin family protein [Metabacillus litoralis]MCM3652050.1 dynamin family protein [Metabacillus litoralis]
MIATLKTDQFMQRLIQLHQTMENDDHERAQKLVELVNKLYNDKLYVAFAGHFSAGKSSMINKLLNEQVLPTSPIPTSANLVLLENGQEQVTLYSKAKEKIELTGDYSIEQIKEYCKHGDEVERVYIKRPYRNLSANVVIMDTPGIDSTDAAHKLSTESMLHIADVIFYVTDYNHVQSEENLSFVKEMKNKDKKIFLIVNQIDKHRENEVPFSEFKQQIETSFAKIGLHQQDVFFTTLMNDQHKHNQLNEIKEIIRVIVDQKVEFMNKNVRTAVNHLITEHLEKYKDQLNLTDVDKSQTLTLMKGFQEKKISLIDQLTEEKRKLKNIETEMNEQVSTILKSANLIPYETREKAAAFIEAVDPSFKVGIIFTKSKTEQERNKRKKELFADLKKNIETQITWHFTPLFKEFIQKYKLHDVNLHHQIQAFSIVIMEKIIVDALKPGASYNNQYILTYSSDVSDLIKKQSKHEVMKIVDQMMNELAGNHQDDIDLFTQELNKCESRISYYEGIILKFDELLSYEKALLKIIDSKIENDLDCKRWLLEHQVYQHRVQRLLKIEKSSKNETEKMGSVLESKKLTKNMDNKEQFINETKEAIKRLKVIRGFKQFTDSLENKVNSYNNREFTVALFGAFSAGKSSFANAMIGERLLPSSPTPTTATINKIAPTTAHKKHGLVEVKLKTKEVLMKEVFESVPSIVNKDMSFADLIDELKNVDGKNQAEKDSIKKYKKALPDYLTLTSNGLHIISTKETFQDFVANEEKACLVEEVIIYYDCPITKAGITLVDTPGADSLHKRHTDVAFQYIKNADAILYVTYYNHPFSKGDREFLRQLGRVKDSFTLDKMFFIINAIDLAKDEQEVELVKDFIRDQLLQQEIRNIRLYGVSSMNILSNKDHSDSDYLQFKERFDYFIKQELTNTSIVSINEDLKRTNERLQSLIQAALKDEAEKEKIKQALIEEKQQVNQQLRDLTNTHLLKNTSQEIEELIFYVKQRLQLRFNDFFRESFHPGVFNQTNNSQQALLTCLNELIRTIEFELVQELQATTLRVESFIKKVLADEFSRISQLIKKQSQSVTLTKIDPQEIQTPNIVVEFSLEMVENLKPALKLFKNPKSFFERNEKKIMSDDLLNRFDGPVSVMLEHYTKEFRQYYEGMVNSIHLSLVETIQVQSDEGFEALLDIQADDTKNLKQEQVKLNAIINLLND